MENSKEVVGGESMKYYDVAKEHDDVAVKYDNEEIYELEAIYDCIKNPITKKNKYKVKWLGSRYLYILY